MAGRSSGGAVLSRDVLLPAGSLDAWRAAQAAGGIVPVAQIGDSIGQGFSAVGGWATYAWWGIVRAALMARLGGHNGTFYPIADAVAVTAGVAPVDQSWTVVKGAGAGETGTATTMGGIWYTGGTGFVGTFTAPVACTALDVIYSQSALGGGANVSVDGGAATPITFGPALSRRQVLSYNGLPNAVHTVTITQTDGAAHDVHVEGIIIYPTGRATRGVQWWRFCRGGLGTGSYLGLGNGAVSTNDGNLAMIADTGAKLVLFCLGINDCQTAVALATYASNVGAAIQVAQDAGASVVLLASYGGAGITHTGAWGGYLAELAALASGYGVALVTCQPLFGGHGVDWMEGPQIHPNNAGAAQIASLLLGVI